MVDIKNMEVTLAMKVPLKLGNKGKKKMAKVNKKALAKKKVAYLCCYRMLCTARPQTENKRSRL